MQSSNDVLIMSHLGFSLVFGGSDGLTEADMGLSCSTMPGSCPRCRESCGDACVCVCHRDEPCVDRCCNLCCQVCLNGCCLICSDDCRYTLCFMCTRIANSCAAVLTVEQPRTSMTQTEGRWRNIYTVLCLPCVITCTLLKFQSSTVRI